MNDATVVSVTEVRNALRCPRVFALGRVAKAVSFPVGSSCLGGAFHRVAERFARGVGNVPTWFDDNTPQDSLERWVLGLLRDEIKGNPLFASLPAEVDDLAEACRAFCAHVAARLQAFPEGPRAALSHMVVSGERPVEVFFPEAGLTLKGRPDALLAKEDGALEVVEYKLTDEANAALDQAQVALYREMLRRAHQHDARPVVLRFNPTLTKTEMKKEEADRLVSARLLPLLREMASWALAPKTAPAPQSTTLCGACPMLKACMECYPQRLAFRDDSPVPSKHPRPNAEGQLIEEKMTIPRPPSDDLEGKKAALAIRERILDEFRREGISAEAQQPVVGPNLYLVPVYPQRGLVGRLDLVAASLCVRLHATEGWPVDYIKRGTQREFSIRRDPPRPLFLNALLQEKGQWLAERPGRFVVGQEPNGGILVGDLGDSTTPHLLVGGQAGSGKSWLLKSLACSLIHFHDPSVIRLTLLDPKRVTFNGEFISAVSAHLDRPVLFNVEDAMPCLEEMVQSMEDRYAILQAEDVDNLYDYNLKVSPDKRLARHVLIMDEFEDLTIDKKAAEAFSLAVGRLSAKARAAGIHLILATQRPVKECVPSKLKANLGGKIALKVASEVNSRVILDEGGAEKLLGKGDLLANLGRGIVRAQAPALA